MPIIKIISGGQTGADQGALAAAHDLGIPTGGFAPKGYLTDTGTNLDLKSKYDLVETEVVNYRHRTFENVKASDGTLILGLPSPGTALTQRCCKFSKKPYHWLQWPGTFDLFMVDQFRDWIDQHGIRTLNVAGNRESRNPGIHDAVYKFLTMALRN